MLSQSGEISPDFCRFYGGYIRHNEDITHFSQNFIVRLIPNHSPPLETRIWKLVVRTLFTLKITSPINSEDHSFYRHIKRLAVRPLSDSKLSRSARVLKSNKGLLLVFN